MRALISVSHKNRVEELAQALITAGGEILSTGGTAQFLMSKGIPVTLIEAYTGSKEALDGRVKTLHPKIYSEILARPDQLKYLEKQGHRPLDLVVVNLYPFQEMLESSTSDQVEYIDIGGVALIRAAAKNFIRTSVLTTSNQYEEFSSRLRNKSVDLPYRKNLAQAAFALTSRYDGEIKKWLEDSSGDSFKPDQVSAVAFPMKYGENPHQEAAFHLAKGQKEPFEKVSGNDLSYNNILDCDCAWRACNKWEEEAAAIVKHATPCGIARGKNLTQAYKLARACDSLSAFGGVAAFNKPVNLELAKTLRGHFLEVIGAPDFADEAVEFLRKAKPRLRLVKVLKKPGDEQIRSALGGYLIQRNRSKKEEFRTVTKKKPTEAMKKDLFFAAKCCEEVKSNAIVITSGTRTVGIGGGMTSRVDAAELAVRKMEKEGQRPRNLAMASDGFIPFIDTVELAADAGVQAIIQPGGSKKDQEVIEAADARNLVMVFTGVRHFRH